MVVSTCPGPEHLREYLPTVYRRIQAALEGTEAVLICRNRGLTMPLAAQYRAAVDTEGVQLGWNTSAAISLRHPSANTPEELAKIVTRSATILGMDIAPEGAMEIASRSRGTPRIANRFLRRVRDFAQICCDGVITREAADLALKRLEVDELGLDNIDRRMLRAIIDFYNGGPVGLETLAATINEDTVTLEDMYEPYLLQQGFLTRTPRGRCVTPMAYRHLHVDLPDEQQSLFT
jgi:hypothetical protein